MKTHKKTKKGFTLLEVMIVIGIIAILGSFLFPKFIGYEGKAKNIKAISTGKQMYTAVMSAYSEKGSDIKPEHICASILELTGATIVKEKVSVTSDNFTVQFMSDGKEYTLFVKVSNGGYRVVNYGSKDIFIENWT